MEQKSNKEKQDKPRIIHGGYSPEASSGKIKPPRGGTGESAGGNNSNDETQK
ncbi:MAG: hypothetical protein H6Q72_4192 [Firmicutes bacterium]|nr:hypothetical protein [Bacillota bacterium]